ncbi:MAG TPA: baseplate J/gp47 family protein [Acetobacteraceae bacterium]|nr:baseplate J/gp47 family protein [Acetobacteraceae bacterium]
MPYARPTLTALYNQALQDIIAAQITDAGGNVLTGLLPNAVLRVVAWVQAGYAFLHYCYQDWIAQQSVPWTATGEFASGWAGLVGVTQKDATASTGTGAFSGTPGRDVPAGTPISRGDGFAYVSTADATVSGGGTVTVPFQAIAPGAAGNAASGAPLAIAAPIAGVNSFGSASGPITGGADQEAFPTFRTRYLQQFAAPPHGGDRADYIEWAEAVAGVTRAWINPSGAGAGTVVLWIMLDLAEAAHGGFPQGSNGVASNETRGIAATGDQLAVANAIFAVEPVTALVYVNAPVAQPVNFTIANFAPNTTPIQAAVQASLADMFLRLGQVGGSVDPADGSSWGTIYPSDIESAIFGTAGVQRFTLVSPSAPIAPAAGSLFTVGSTSFTP